MYQGKFNRGQDSGTDVYTLIRQREENRQPKAPRPGTAPGRQAAPTRPGTAPARQTAPARPAPAEQTAAPAAANTAAARKSTLVFAAWFMGFVFVFYLATFLGLSWLRGWLVRFEASQPTAASQQVFQNLFAQPDWDRLYDLAGVTGDRAAFRAHMEQQVGAQQLTFLETSAGLDQSVKKYVVRLDNQRIAAFTLRDLAGETADVPDWQLGTVEFYIQGGETYQLRLPQGAKAWLGETALGEEAVVSVSTSPAGKYLPTFAAVPSTVTLQTGELLSEPVFRVEDASGKPLEVTLDPETGIYTAGLTAEEIPQDRQELALNAVKAYARFMANEGGIAEVNKYFDRDSETYRSIAKTERYWIQTGSAYSLTDEEVTGYRTYGDSLFSVRVTMNQNVTRSEDGSVKVTPIAQSLFFTPNSSGKWVCFQMTGEDMEQWDTQVKLTFRDGDQLLSSELVEEDAASVTCPLVTAPEGKTFSGWATRETDGKGGTVMHLVFTPDETGAVTLAAGNVLQPMVLYPVFE